MQRAQLLLLALTATLAACASNTPATSVIVGTPHSVRIDVPFSAVFARRAPRTARFRRAPTVHRASRINATII